MARAARAGASAAALLIAIDSYDAVFDYYFHSILLSANIDIDSYAISYAARLIRHYG
jgi:hypothetical protein